MYTTTTNKKKYWSPPPGAQLFTSASLFTCASDRFFLAGSGRKGAISRNTWYYILRDTSVTIDRAMIEMRKDKVVVLESTGYDQYYILPGGAALVVENDGLDDKLVGASKGKLKTAFAKSSKGRIQSRVLLNKFVGMVA